MPRGGQNLRTANVILPAVSEEVHRMVNLHRTSNGLPEWDFEQRPSEQWWKLEPLVNFLVERILFKMRDGRKHFDGWKVKRLECDKMKKRRSF